VWRGGRNELSRGGKRANVISRKSYETLGLGWWGGMGGGGVEHKQNVRRRGQAIGCRECFGPNSVPTQRKRKKEG